MLLLAPLPALAIGLLVMWRAGVTPLLLQLNLAAAVAGATAMLVAVRRGSTASQMKPAAVRRGIAVGLVLLAASLLIPGPEGIRRWLPLGPLQIHVAAVVLPPVLVLLGAAGRRVSIVAALVTASVLLLQPDAAQAAAFALGWSTLVARAPGRVPVVAIVCVLAVGVLTLLRADTLQPVPHVEGIVGLAAGQGTPWLVAGLAALALLPAAFLSSGSRPAGAALAAYMACTLVAAWLGHYPVPVMGYGVSPILGYYLGAWLSA